MVLSQIADTVKVLRIMHYPFDFWPEDKAQGMLYMTKHNLSSEVSYQVIAEHFLKAFIVS